MFKKILKLSHKYINFEIIFSGGLTRRRVKCVRRCYGDIAPLRSFLHESVPSFALTAKAEVTTEIIQTLELKLPANIISLLNGCKSLNSL